MMAAYAIAERVIRIVSQPVGFPAVERLSIGISNAKSTNSRRRYTSAGSHYSFDAVLLEPGTQPSSSSDFTSLYTLVSSANIATLLLVIDSGRLFAYNKKRAGPRIEPWGTLEVTGKSRDVAPRTVMRWRLPCRYAWNHVSRFPLKP